MAYLGKIVYLTEAQLATLIANNTITVSGVTITYNENDIYITSDTSMALNSPTKAVVTDSNNKIITLDLTTTSPTASGTTLSFIDTISQDSQGKITATKKTVPITYGTADPSGGSNGDIYFQYEV